jgi:hypothetical protein
MQCSLLLATQAYDHRAFVSAQQCKSDVGKAVNKITPPSRIPAAAAVRAGDALFAPKTSSVR